MRANYHIAGIALGLVTYTIGEFMCWLLDSTGHLFPFTRNLVVYFINYLVFFGIFGLAIWLIVYCTSKHGEKMSLTFLTREYKVILYLMYIVFALFVPVYLVFRMLSIAFDLAYTLETACVIYLIVILLFSYVRKWIFV